MHESESPLENNLAMLAAEPQDTFLRRSRELLHELPETFASAGDRLLLQLRTGSQKGISEVVFVPIKHDVRARGLNVAAPQELLAALEDAVQPSTLLASGEHVASPLNDSTMAASRLKGMDELAAIGLADSNAHIRARLARLLDPFEAAILQLIALHPSLRAEGVDSRAGAIIITALEKIPSLITGDEDDAIANELKYRFLEAENAIRLATS